MSRPIFSEDHAERVGRERTGGERGRDFIVFRYPHKPSNLTAFAVEVIRTGQIIGHT